MDSRMRGGVARGIEGTREGVNAGVSSTNLDDLFTSGSQCGSGGDAAASASFMQGWSIVPSLARVGSAALTRTVKSLKERIWTTTADGLQSESEIIYNYEPTFQMRLKTTCVDTQYSITPGACVTETSANFASFAQSMGAASIHATGGFQTICSQGRAMTDWKMVRGGNGYSSANAHIEMTCCEGALNGSSTDEYTVSTEFRQHSTLYADMAKYTTPVACREGDLMAGWRSHVVASYVTGQNTAGTRLEAVCRKPSSSAAAAGGNHPKYVETPDVKIMQRYSVVLYPKKMDLYSFSQNNAAGPRYVPDGHLIDLLHFPVTCRAGEYVQAWELLDLGVAKVSTAITMMTTCVAGGDHLMHTGHEGRPIVRTTATLRGRQLLLNKLKDADEYISME
jgi:hypothetical protein